MKLNLDKYFAVDRDAAENGKWFEIAPGIEFKIRRHNSKHVSAVQRKLAAKYPNGQPPSSETEDFALRVLAEGVIANWRGVADENGNEISYSPEMAYRILKEYPDLAEMVSTITMDMNRFRTEEDEELVKN